MGNQHLKIVNVVLWLSALLNMAAINVLEYSVEKCGQLLGVCYESNNESSNILWQCMEDHCVCELKQNW